MTSIRVGELDIAYESQGPISAPAILFIQGLGMPLTAWPDEFIQAFLDEGFRTVCFDNRDIGRSSKLDHFQVPNISWQAFRYALGIGVQAPYTLQSMANDASGLLEALKIDRAHVVGISMGGMIAQLLAIASPNSLLSLTSIMSTTGRRSLPKPAAKIRRQLLRRPRSNELSDVLDHGMKTWRLIGSPAYPASEEERRAFLLRNVKRGVPRQGIARQLLAIAAASPRTEQLMKISVPTLVIHGRDDPLVPVAAGKDTANSIPGASLHVVSGMGHDLPAPVLGHLAEEMILHFRASVVGR